MIICKNDVLIFLNIRSLKNIDNQKFKKNYLINLFNYIILIFLIYINGDSQKIWK